MQYPAPSHSGRSAKAALLCGLMLFAGCTVGPHYQKPALTTPAAWTAGPATSAQATLEQDWWKHLNDPVLDGLIKEALAGNYDLKIAEARIAQARATQAYARADILPSADVKGSVTREGNELPFPGGTNLPFDLTKPFNIFQTGFDASWELDLFGGKRSAEQGATAEFQAAQATRDDMRISVLAEVARTYIDIRGNQQQLTIANDRIAAEQETLKIAKERFASGDAPKLDVIQAQSQLEQAESQLPHYQNLLIQSELAIDVLLGHQPGYTQGLVTEVKPVPVGDKNLVLAAPADVIAHRPDIHAAERQLASATAQQDVATAQLFPDVSLSGFFGLFTTEGGQLLHAASRSWNIGGSVIWPILNYSRISANIDLANAKQQEALAQYQKSIVGALSDVERSLTAYSKEEEHRDLLEKTVATNHKAVDIARERYKAGLSSFIEVLDAERTLYTSQSQAADADAATTQNLIAMYKSLGGGWQEKPPQSH